MKIRRFVNKIICVALVGMMLYITGCQNKGNIGSDADTDVILDNMNNSSEQNNSASYINNELSSVEKIEDSEVKSVETSQSYDGSIKLENGDISFEGNGITVDQSTATITKSGTYIISGKLDDGQIIVDTDKNSSVNLILNGVNINCSYSSAIYSKKAKETTITILEGSINKLSDGSNYDTDTSNTDAPTACIYVQDDLAIEGTGTLNVTGNFNDAVTSKDVLTINGGVLLISSADDGIIGRDGLIVKNGDIKIEAVGDGLKSTNDEDLAKGYITIEDGIFSILAGADGIQAETDLTVNGGSFNISTGGGSENGSTKSDGTANEKWGSWGERPNKMKNADGTQMTPPEAPAEGEAVPPELPSKENGMELQSPVQSADTSVSASEDDAASAKALKCKQNLIINGGNFTIDSSDDSIHSNLNVTINNAEINIMSGDDGIHADSTVTINDGAITISKSYEGVEGANIDIFGGSINITSSDDGINVAGGNDSSSVSGRPGQNSFSSNSGGKLTINGGNIIVDASGDGLDANGSIYMEGGNVTVFGPANDGNGSLDYDGEFKISGGLLIAVGSAGMAQSVTNTSTQCSASVTLDSAIAENKEVTLKDKNGNTIASVTTKKQTQNIIISSPNIEQISDYELYADGELIKEFSTTGVVTNIGNRTFGTMKKQ